MKGVFSRLRKYDVFGVHTTISHTVGLLGGVCLDSTRGRTAGNIVSGMRAAVRVGGVGGIRVGIDLKICARETDDTLVLMMKYPGEKFDYFGKARLGRRGLTGGEELDFFLAFRDDGGTVAQTTDKTAKIRLRYRGRVCGKGKEVVVTRSSPIRKVGGTEFDTHTRNTAPHANVDGVVSCLPISG